MDIAIVILVLIDARRGAIIGFLRSAFSLSGFTFGLLAGAVLVPQLLSLTSSPSGKLLIAVTTVLLLAVLGGLIGRNIGARLAHFGERLKLGPLDASLGAVLSGAISLVIIWFVASVFSGLPFPGLNSAVQHSVILQSLNHRLPPTPAILSQITQAIRPYGFPQVFVGPPPLPAEPVDPATAADIEQAVLAAKKSTVKIEGTGCGGLVMGSGFVAQEGFVITNAHVVAGVHNPIVYDENGYHRATTVYFDSNKDIAVLRVQNMAGKPLHIADELAERGTKAVVLGYPGGGPFRANAAGIMRQFQARGRDIYNEKVVLRSVYEMQTTVQSGNSGGPVVTPDGIVIGAVFARAETGNGIGYAVTSPSLINALNSAQTAQPVDTGRCTNN